MNLYNLLDKMISKINKSIQTESQTLTETEKSQARNNINTPSKKEVFKRNLLDNSDFRNLVNQRGETTYTEHYGFDRWRIYSADTSMIQQNGYMTVTGVVIAQNLSNIDENTIYTMAAKKTDGTIYVASGTFTAGAANGGISFNSSTVATPSVFLAAGDWVWAALYEGSYTAETLPNYQPKGYAVELAECQRYYQCFQSLVGEGASTPQRLFLTLPIAMRIIPTIDYTIQAGVTPAHIVMQAENIIDIKAADSSYSHLIIRLSADL